VTGDGRAGKHFKPVLPAMLRARCHESFSLCCQKIIDLVVLCHTFGCMSFGQL
jgi:hypothetical protein